MTSGQNRIVVVLGMHRSGTSALTRALQACGVGLGEKLIPGIGGVNDKGFFEDSDFMQLNEKLLRKADCSWDTLSAVTSHAIEVLVDSEYFLQAVELLKLRTASERLFAFKDPRTAKLLAFWKKVFAFSGYSVSYLIVIRNPLSVAMSLRKRDSFAVEKGYVLWMGHVVNSLRLTINQNRALIDYDEFLQQPEKALDRLSQRLALIIDEGERVKFLAEFLDVKLRHAAFTAEELAVDTTCPELAREIYETLRAISARNDKLDLAAFAKMTQRWAREFEREQASWHWMDQLLADNARLAEMEKARHSDLDSLIRSIARRNPETISKAFNGKLYLAQNPDVARAGIDPLRHYLDAGSLEGRPPGVEVPALIEALFREYASALENSNHKVVETKELSARQLRDASLEQEFLKAALQDAIGQRDRALREKQDAQKRVEHLQAELLAQSRGWANQLQTLHEESEVRLREHLRQEQQRIVYSRSIEARYDEHLGRLDQQLSQAREELSERDRKYEGTLKDIADRDLRIVRLTQEQFDAESAAREWFEKNQALLATSSSQESAILDLTQRLREMGRFASDLELGVAEGHSYIAAFTTYLIGISRSVFWSKSRIPRTLDRLLSTIEAGVPSENIEMRRTVIGIGREPPNPVAESIATIGRSSFVYYRVREIEVRPGTSIAEIVQHHGKEFIQCAYVTILRRQPDGQGYKYYLSRLLSGSPKLQILLEISESEEGRRIGSKVPGLPEALGQYKRARNPFLRAIVPWLATIEVDAPNENRLRAIEQRSYIQGQNINLRAHELSTRVPELHSHDEGWGTESKTSSHAVTRFELETSDGGARRTILAALPEADGTWEWSDYQVTKDRIASAINSRKASFAPKKLELIEIEPGAWNKAVSQVVLQPPGDTPDVSIIVPVFNNLQLTLECLISIAKHDDPSVTFEILVTDDASTDETRTVVSAIRHVRLLNNPVNLGFLRNCNRALDSARGRYVVFLNNDVQVTDGWLTTLLKTFIDYPMVGAVGPRYLYPSGYLQEVGASIRPDASVDMVGLNESPDQKRFSYTRRVDYTSGACLMLSTQLARELKGFSEEYLPCYCEDSDLCLRIQAKGYFIYCNPGATIIHHLSKTTAPLSHEFKYQCIAKNVNTLSLKWANHIESSATPRVIAFYLPQFHPIPQNDHWWGAGFTEWTNVSKARQNFEGHYQPRFPADLGYYDLRSPDVMEKQAELARNFGIDGFCFYYYWFDGKRLLEKPIEQMLDLCRPHFPFCLCWANENWSRRWDGRSEHVLMAQKHSPQDDLNVIEDLARFFRDSRYIRVDGRPLILVYRVQLFPNFAETAARWRKYCRDIGIGEIYISMVESFELVHLQTHPSVYGCDSSVEFPPQELADTKPPGGLITNPNFDGNTADYRDLAVRFATRELPPYTRFCGVAPGWDNTPRSQDRSFCFEYATPGAFQAWIEEAIELTRAQHYGDERLIFVNAWNEWAEGAYLEPDRRFGHTYLEAVRNAKDAARLIRKGSYGLGQA